ncbi:MAG: DUF4760 domain-containing protein, partial [Candidatus Ratteibacteria bacterium]
MSNKIIEILLERLKNPEWWQAGLTILLIYIAWRQLKLLLIQSRADLIHKIYQGLIEWLEKHPEARNWIYKLDRKISEEEFGQYFLDDFLGYFEEIWSLSKKDLIDFDLVYDLFSDYLIEPYEFQLKEIITILREKERKPDLYEGLEELYERMKNYEN